MRENTIIFSLLSILFQMEQAEEKKTLFSSMANSVSQVPTYQG